MYLLCCRLINDTQVESEEEKHREIWKRAGKNMYIQKKEKKKKKSDVKSQRSGEDWASQRQLKSF